MYLEYEEYQNMGGTLDIATFLDLEREAEAEINWLSFSRLKKETVIPQEVKDCCYKLLQILQQKQLAYTVGQAENSVNSPAIASQSNDGVSISYNTMNASEIVQGAKATMHDVIKMYLDSTRTADGRKLLYRGVYPNE